MCALSKITKTPVQRKAEVQSEYKLERVFTDLMEPFRVHSLSGFRFFIVFAGPYANFVFVDLLKAKNEALASLKKFVLSVGTSRKRTKDNAKEFLKILRKCLRVCLKSLFKMYCLDAGIF